MKTAWFILFTWGWLVSAPVTFGQFGAASPLLGKDANPIVRVTHQWSATGVKPGGQITLALVLDIRPPYHINADQTKEGFIPTTVELLDIPAPLRSSTPMYPEPHQIEFGSGVDKEKIAVFSERVVVYMPMSVTTAVQPGELEFQVKVGYQACDDKTCLFPTDVTQNVKLTVVSSGTDVQAINPEIFAGMQDAKERLNIAFFGWDFKVETSKLWLLLIVAGIGGMLLNFTPCVLPLIPIKIMGLSHAAGNRGRCLFLGFILASGVVAFWVALAVAISSISGFDATNKLFQFPAFTIGVGLIICIMAIGMCGLFSLALPQWVYRVNPSQESIGGSFLFGVMTAVLSTPCTAPFMGAAAAWSATQRPVITLATFAAIGVGMALPYVVLSAFPFLVRRMPRTGPASELIKQVMGLLLLAAGAYFLGTGVAGLLAKPPDPPTAAYWWVVALFLAAAGGWLIWRTLQISQRMISRIVFVAIGGSLVAMALALGVTFTKGSPVRWIYYTPERLAQAQQQGKVVVLEFTAAWCLNCHALEQAVLHHPAIVQLLNEGRVAPFKVDITGNNPAGHQKLVEVGRRTIPYLVVYGPGGKEIFASDAYTVDQLRRALREAKSASL